MSRDRLAGNMKGSGYSKSGIERKEDDYGIK